MSEGKYRSRKHYYNHLDEMRKRKLNYYYLNKDTINKKRNEKIFCDVCNSHVTSSNLQRHKRSKKHIKNKTKIQI